MSALHDTRISAEEKSELLLVESKWYGSWAGPRDLVDAPHLLAIRR